MPQAAAVYPAVYTLEEFAKLFKLSPAAVRTLIRKEEILAIRIGKQYRIPQSVVDQYFAQALPAEERGFGMWKHKQACCQPQVRQQSAQPGAAHPRGIPAGYG